MASSTWLLYAIVLVAYANNFYEISCTAAFIPDFKLDNATELHVIGSVEGKTFFADMTKRNWIDSRKVCQDVGMRLASITTLAQRSRLLKAYHNDTFNSWFWTGGRDSQVPSQLVWDESGGTPIEAVITPLRRINGIRTCLAINIQSNETLVFDLDSCGFSCGVICEMYHGVP